MYVSLPITGYDLKERRETAISKGHEASLQLMKEKGYTQVDVVTPFDVCKDTDKPYEELIGMDITALMTCDHMVLLQGWKNSRGCRIEKAVAEEMQINIFTISQGKEEE